MFVAPLFASMSVAAAHSAGAFRAQLEGYAKLLLSLSALFAVAGYFLAPFFLRLLYGERYASGEWSSVSSFRWLALGYLFALVTPVLAVGESTQRHVRALLLTGIACLGLNLAGNAWAIPRYAAEGAAMVLCACEGFVFMGVGHEKCDAARAAPQWRVGCLSGAGAGAGGGAVAAGRIATVQLTVACVFAPLAMFVIIKLPAQKACRASPRAGRCNSGRRKRVRWHLQCGAILHERAAPPQGRSCQMSRSAQSEGAPVNARRESPVLVRGSGSTVTTSDGRTLVDLAMGFGAAFLGHAHPVVTASLQQQAGDLISCGRNPH